MNDPDITTKQHPTDSCLCVCLPANLHMYLIFRGASCSLSWHTEIEGAEQNGNFPLG